MHFFFKNDDDNDGFQRTLLSDNSLETFPSAGDVDISTLRNASVPGISYDNDGVQKIRCPYMDANGKASYAEFNSVDAPGAFTPNVDVTNNVVFSTNQSPVACLAVDGLDEHLLFAVFIAVGDVDLFHVENGGSDIKILDGLIRRISSNVYDRSGTKLSYVYEDSGSIKYNELDIAVTSSFSGSDFPTQNYYVGPFSGSL